MSSTPSWHRLMLSSRLLMPSSRRTRSTLLKSSSSIVISSETSDSAVDACRPRRHRPRRPHPMKCEIMISVDYRGRRRDRVPREIHIREYGSWGRAQPKAHAKAVHTRTFGSRAPWALGLGHGGWAGGRNRGTSSPPTHSTSQINKLGIKLD